MTRGLRARTLSIPRHRATTAHLCSAYPFLGDAGFGARGIYLGANVLSGGAAFAFDPFTAYADGLLTNPNLIVAGDVGMGKSTAVKAFLNRAIGTFGRWAAIVDPKGEYGPLAEQLDMTMVQLHPGGSHRLNPLDTTLGCGHDAVDRAREQGELVAALVGHVLRRDLNPVEDAAIHWALVELARAPTSRPRTLSDLVAVLRDPTEHMATRADLTRGELTRRAAEVTYAVGKLVERAFHGMFDGPTNVRIDRDGPGMVLDVSAIFHDRDALGLVLLAITAWLRSVLAQQDGPQRLQVIDEAWAVFGNERAAKYLQACWKLSRAYGVANVAVIHRLSDLRAQADDGTTTAKVAMGLLADTQTRVLFRQAPDQIDDARQLLGLTGVEADLLTRLTRGRALWKIASRTAVVQHVVGPTEYALADTNARMHAHALP